MYRMAALTVVMVVMAEMLSLWLTLLLPACAASNKKEFTGLVKVRTAGERKNTVRTGRI